MKKNNIIRYVVNFDNQDQDNFSSYNCLLDKDAKSPYLTSYSFAICAASNYRGTVYSHSIVDGIDVYNKVKDYSKTH